MYRNREQLATRWAHFFKKRRAYRRRFRFWHHIPHTVLWPACLPGNPIIPRSSGTRHSFGLRPPAGGTRSIRPIPCLCPRLPCRAIPPHPSGPVSLFACVHQAGGTRSIRPIPCLPGEQGRGRGLPGTGPRGGRHRTNPAPFVSCDTDTAPCVW